MWRTRPRRAPGGLIRTARVLEGEPRHPIPANELPLLGRERVGDGEHVVLIEPAQQIERGLDLPTARQVAEGPGADEVQRARVAHHHHDHERVFAGLRIGQEELCVAGLLVELAEDPTPGEQSVSGAFGDAAATTKVSGRSWLTESLKTWEVGVFVADLPTGVRESLAATQVRPVMVNPPDEDPIGWRIVGRVRGQGRVGRRLERRSPEPPERRKPRGCGASGDAPDRTRTCDLRFRRPTLYPPELLARDTGGYQGPCAPQTRGHCSTFDGSPTSSSAPSWPTPPRRRWRSTWRPIDIGVMGHQRPVRRHDLPVQPLPLGRMN